MVMGVGLREADMVLLIILFDRPADLDGSGYRERSRNWIAELTKLDGFVEFSAQ